jgi:hypothetical protein
MNFKMSSHGLQLPGAWKVFGLLVALLSPILGSALEEEANVSFDGLLAIEKSRVYMAYIDPNADFSVFQIVAILDPHVAF